MDSVAEQLLLQIARTPDDDACRLVYADHIAETHPEHSALIVQQCAGLGSIADARAAFLRTVPEPLRETVGRAPITRGFAELARWSFLPDEFLADPDAPFRIAPTCRELELRIVTRDHLPALASTAALSRYAHFALTSSFLFGADAEPLARCPHLAQLEYLKVGGSLFQDALAFLVGERAFPRLACLDLGAQGVHVTDRSPVDALPGAAFAPTLRALDITKSEIGDETATLVAQLPSLTSLALAFVKLTDAGLHELARLPHRFRYLDLSTTLGATPSGLLALARSPALSKLEHLLVDPDDCGKHLGAILGSLPALTRLNIDDFTMPIAPVIDAIATSHLPRQLTSLALDGNFDRTTSTAFSEIAFGRLEELAIRNLDDAGIALLARSPIMANLRFLDLWMADKGNITDTAAFALADAPHARSDLRIHCYVFGTAARAALAERFGPDVLEWRGVPGSWKRRVPW